jgi:hypothetical protein
MFEIHFSSWTGGQMSYQTFSDSFLAIGAADPMQE